MPRYLLPLLIVLVLLLSGASRAVAPAVAAGDPVQGDVTCDSSVNSVDSLQILRSVAGLATTAGCLSDAGDVNCDGGVNSVDSLRILRYVAGLSNTTPDGCVPIGEPLEEAEIGSPAEVNLAGASETSFNTLSSSLQFEITGANLSADPADALLLMNDEPVPEAVLQVSGNTISPDLTLQDGPNHLLLLAADEEGLLIYYEATLWAGDESLAVAVADANGNPADGATVTARLLDDPGVAVSATSVNGQAEFENLPNRTILLSASSGDDLSAETSLDLGAPLGGASAAGSCVAAAAGGCSTAEMQLARRQFAITGLVLNDIDDTELRFLSTAAHTYFSGNTRIHGKVTITGGPCDELKSLELEVLEGGKVVATARLAENAKGKLLKPFPANRKLEITVSQLLFELPSSEGAKINQSADGPVTLRVRAKSVGGFEAEYVFGAVPKLVRYTNGNRYGSRNGTLGGDDWVKPSVKKVVENAAGATWDSFSNMNGGKFAPHVAHQTGNDIDGWFTGYNARNAATAATMIGYLNTTYGPRISAVLVTYDKSPANTFWNAIKGVTLADGRLARDVIRPKASHDTHFHWVVREAGGGGAAAQLPAGSARLNDGSGSNPTPAVANGRPCWVGTATGINHYDQSWEGGRDRMDAVTTARIVWEEDNIFAGCNCTSFFATGVIDWTVNVAYESNCCTCSDSDGGQVEAGKVLHDEDQILIIGDDANDDEQYWYVGRGRMFVDAFIDCEIAGVTSLPANDFFDVNDATIPDIPEPTPTPTPTPNATPFVAAYRAAAASDSDTCGSMEFTFRRDATTFSGSCYRYYASPDIFEKFEWSFTKIDPPD